jgi:hypothetical protein
MQMHQAQGTTSMNESETDAIIDKDHVKHSCKMITYGFQI